MNNDFQTFWERYGKKRNRMDAEQAWHRLNDKDQRAALRGIADYRRDCRQKGIAMAYAQRYLSERLWEKGPARLSAKPGRPTSAAATPPPDPETW